MIDKDKLHRFIEEELKQTPCFLVELSVSPGNEIRVEIDSDEAVDIDRCIALTRAIEAEFDREEEDYELEVGSAGLTSPLRVEAQYRKNIGNMLDILTADGKKIKALLKAVNADGITIEMEQKVKKEGMKRPVVETMEKTLTYPEIKKAVYHLEF